MLHFIIGSAYICNAQTTNSEDQIITDTTINYEQNIIRGHRFISNPYVQSPFINTYLETLIGAGQTNVLDFPPIMIDTIEIILPKGDLAFSYAEFEYQQAVKDWIAFSMRFNFVGRIGTDAQALISQGVNVAAGFSFGWLIKLYRDNNSMLSGTMKISSNYVTFIDLYDFVEGIIDSGKITKENTLIKTTPVTLGSFGVSYVYAFNRIFGITAAGTASYGESAERYSEDEWNFNYGVSVDADLNPQYSVPIALALSYFGVTRGKNTTSTLGDSQNIAFQINYTGKRDLDLGLIYNYQWFKNGNLSDEINFSNIYLDLKYYFF